MIFFFVWAIYLLFKRKWFWTAILIGVSVSVKLLPLLFLPLFFKYFTSKNKSPKVFATFGISIQKLLSFYLIIGLTVLLSFLPFLSSEFIENFSSTIALWFQNFEFNASIYYMIRWIGFQVVGWNLIETVGKILPILILLFVLLISFFRKNNTPQQLLTAMLFAISILLLMPVYKGLISLDIQLLAAFNFCPKLSDSSKPLVISGQELLKLLGCSGSDCRAN